MLCKAHCQAGGMLLVTPEQRLSLQLKWHEMWAKGEEEVCKALEDISSMPYQDFLDESDELLHHRYVHCDTYSRHLNVIHTVTAG